MRVSFEWLREFVPVQITPEAVADRLTMAGLEVEDLEEWGRPFERIICGKVVAISAHSSSGRLLVCRVDVGAQVLTIVSGAQNIAVGDHVPVAIAGAVLPNGKSIGAEPIGGIISEGMLCSAAELGFSDTSNGILILPQATAPGMSFASAFELRDVVLEVNVTPNRPDCLNIFGIAREVAALTEVPLTAPDARVPEMGEAIETLTSVQVEAPDLCPRYAARLISQLHVGPSPFWMQRRLLVCGSRPRNNVVDATNYLLLELGHPLHAFDFQTLQGGRIIVRVARPGEVCVTLDGLVRRLDPSILVIADAEQPVGIAGVMGGQNSEIRDHSATVLLESAYFQPQNIRRTAKKLGLRTEASYRFERGADFDGLLTSLDRCAALIARLAGGTVAPQRLDVTTERYVAPHISVRINHLNRVLGVQLTPETVQRYFARLQLPTATDAEAQVEVEVPSFRRDLTQEIDLIEEVGRLHSYQAIPTSLPRVQLAPVPRLSQREATRAVGEWLLGCGYTQIINYSFMPEEDLDRLQLPANDPLRRVVPLRNPLSQEAGVLRTTLIPSLLRTIALNLNRDLREVMIFELSRVFHRQQGVQPQELPMLALAATGTLGAQHWGESAHAVDFYDLVGTLELIASRLQRQPLVVTAAALPFCHPGKAAHISFGDDLIGVVGEVHPNVLAAFGLSQVVTVAEVDLHRLLGQGIASPQYRQIPRFPAVTRDLSIIIDAAMPAGQILTELQHFHPALLREVRLFDVYAGQPVPTGKKSLTFALIYRADDRTLTDEEVNSIQTRVIEHVRHAFGAQLRGQEGNGDYGHAGN